MHVFHVRELSHLSRVPPIETEEDAAKLVADAVFRLRMSGVEAGGRSWSSRHDRVALRIDGAPEADDLGGQGVERRRAHRRRAEGGDGPGEPGVPPPEEWRGR